VRALLAALALAVVALVLVVLLLWRTVRAERQREWPAPPLTPAQARWLSTRRWDLDPDATEVFPTITDRPAVDEREGM
jgi:hypothetical protein